MDGTQDIAAIVVSHVLQPHDHIVGRIGVQTAGGLVQENQLGFHDELNTHTGAFLLSTRYTSNHVIPNKGVCTFLQAQVFQHLLHHLLLVFSSVCVWKPKVG